VYVSALPGDETPTPSITSTNCAGATSVSGTSSTPDGTIIHVYANGTYLGQATVASGAWTLSSIGPLTAGTVLFATATDLANDHGTSAPSSSVTVNPTPDATITPSGPTTFCEGGSVTLDAGLHDSYLWSTGATTQAILVSTSGSYTVTVTDEGCPSAPSDPVVVTVNPTPTATITPSGPTSFCLGGSVTLDAGLHDSYLWSTGATTQAILVSTSGSYTVTVTDEGCPSAPSDPVVVTVNPIPAVSDVTMQASSGTPGPPWGYPVGGSFAAGFDMCVDAGVEFYYLDVNTLTASTGLKTDTLNPFLLDQASLPPTWLSYWDVKGVNAGALPGTWQAVMYQIIIGAQPIFYIYYTGADYQLVDGLTYQIGGGITPLRVSGDYPQWNYKYTGTVTSAANCVSSFFDVFFEFNTAPVVSDVTMQASSGTPGPPWDYAVGGDFATGFDMCIDAGVAFYYLDVNALTASTGLKTDALNPFLLDQASLPPTWLSYWDAKGVNAGAAPGTWQAVMYQIILGAQPIFYIYYSGGDYRLIDGLTYQMGGGLTPLRVSGDYPQWNYKYTGTVTGANDCVSSFFDVFFEFNPIPAATITPDGPTTFCEGGSVTLDAGLHDSYLWSTGATTQTIVVSTSGSYTVTVTDEGCPSAPSDPMVVTVNPTPDATITAAAAVCALSAGNTASVPAGADTYAWTITNGTITAGDGTASITYTASSTSPVGLGVTVTTAGCPSTGSASVTVNALPVATASNSGPVYTGDPVTLTGGPDGMVTYSWTGPDSWTSDQQSPTRNPAVAGVYSLTVTDGNGCASAPATTTVVVNPPPIVSDPPIVSSPVYAGATIVYGSSVEPPGSTITVYVNGALVGTTLVLADGTWNFAVPPLSEGNTLSATAQAVGEQVSGLSNVVVVCADETDRTPPPIITGPIIDGAVIVPGTSLPNATVDVYADGHYLGTTTADGSGTWTLTGVPPLPGGTILTGTATLGPAGTSVMGPPVVVGSVVHLMRSDKITAIGQSIAPCFDRPWDPAASSMDPIGTNHTADYANGGEGAAPQPSAPDTGDGDKAYMRNITTGAVDDDPTVLTDDGRPLVFYELLDNDAHTLYLKKQSGQIVFTIDTP
jgi:hypothetical protein